MGFRGGGKDRFLLCGVRCSWSSCLDVARLRSKNLATFSLAKNGHKSLYLAINEDRVLFKKKKNC
jgi:hypothetical protein